jgi:hypothetical protein
MARRQDGNMSADRNDGHESSPDKIPRYSNAAQQRDDRKILPKEGGRMAGSGSIVLKDFPPVTV